MLDYNIIWFEDSIDYVSSLEPSIVEFVQDLGFNLKILRKSDDRDLEKIMNSVDVDLILMDHMLSSGHKGDNIVKAIRKNELYTEAVFYSQFPDFQSKIIDHLEGVYFTERKNLLDKTKKIIELTIKKNQDISNVRGMFIAETIYITGQMEEIIAKILDIKKDQLDFFKDQVVQEESFNDILKFKIIKRYLKQKIKFLKKKLEAENEPKKNELSSIIRQWEEIDEDFKKYQTEIIEFRNELAHAKNSPDKKNVLIIRDKNKGEYIEIKFDLNKCKKSRECFNNHSKNLNKLLSLMSK